MSNGTSYFYLLICLFTYINELINLITYLFLSLFVCLFIYLVIYVCMYVCMYLRMYLFILFISLFYFFILFFYLSTVSIYLFHYPHTLSGNINKVCQFINRLQTCRTRVKAVQILSLDLTMYLVSNDLKCI